MIEKYCTWSSRYGVEQSSERGCVGYRKDKMEKKTQKQRLEIGRIVQSVLSSEFNSHRCYILYSIVGKKSHKPAETMADIHSISVPIQMPPKFLLFPPSKIIRASSVSPLIVPCISRPGNLPVDLGLT